MRKAFSVIAVLLVSVMLFASGAGEAESSDTLQVMLTSDQAKVIPCSLCCRNGQMSQEFSLILSSSPTMISCSASL